MSIQWADDFGRYGIGSASDDRMRDGLPYNNWITQCVADPDPLATGERCVFIDNGTNNNPLNENRIALPTPYAGTVGVAARNWFYGFNSGSIRQCVAIFAAIDLTPLACCHVEPNGALTIRNGRTGAIIDETVSPVISTNSWNHIETAYDGTTGAMEVRVNGITVLSGVAATLGTIAFAHPMKRIDTGGGGQTIGVKDLVIWDDTGTQNNDFMGSVICRRFKPNADVTLGGWVPSTGAVGFSLLAKDAPNDTTYLSADDTPPAAMEYGVENLPIDVTSVRGIVAVVRARKIDGGDANLQTALISNAAVDNGADRPITTAFTYYFDISELSPDTAAPWTPVEFDAMTASVDRTV
jgi:hypothetical protein